MEIFYCFLVLIFFFYFVIKLLFTRNRNLPPAPFALPIIGHLHLLKKPLRQSLESLMSQHGPILYLRLGSRPVLVVSSPSAVEECFTKNDVTFANRPQSMAGDHFTYNYKAFVWAPYGHNWRILRRFTVVEIFSSNALHRSSSALQTEVHHLLRRVFRNSTRDGGDDRRKVELKTLFTLLMINFMIRMVAGRPGTEDEATAELEVEKKFLAEFREKFFPSLAMNLCDFFPILRLLGYGGIEKGFVKLQKMRDEYLQSLIDEIRLKKTHRNMKQGGEKKFTPLIETLLSLQQSEPEFYADDVIKSLVVIMFIAGVETTSNTLVWAMSLLNHPEAMQKVRAEIDTHVGHGCLLKDSDLVKLPYLRCVINETLRLYPPAPLLLPHSTAENCTVGGYSIPRGTMLMVNAWAMHRDPKLWEDPAKFKPDRFEGNSSGGVREGEGFEYIPFGMGRRTCPGAAMGIRAVSLALGSVIQCFEWENFGQEEVDMREVYGLSETLSKAEPLVAVCRPRQSMIELLCQI